MKLIANIIGFIIGVASIILIFCEMMLFIYLSKQAYLWGKKRLRAIQIKQIQRCNYASVEIRAYRTKFLEWFADAADACGVSFKSIASHGIRFILLMIVPVSLILIVYSYKYASSYEKLEIDRRIFYLEQKQFENTKKDYELSIKLDSVKNSTPSMSADTIKKINSIYEL